MYFLNFPNGKLKLWQSSYTCKHTRIHAHTEKYMPINKYTYVCLHTCIFICQIFLNSLNPLDDRNVTFASKVFLYLIRESSSKKYSMHNFLENNFSSDRLLGKI